MLSPLIPVKLGEKGPPYLKEWQTESVSSLEYANKKFAHSNKGLRLDNYLALDPDDKPAAEILDGLDKKGDLPPTVSWLTWRGMKVRVYQRPNGLQPVKPTQSPKLEIRTGMGQYVLVPPSIYKGKLYEWVKHQGPDDMEVAVLPHDTLSRLLDILNCSSSFTSKPSTRDLCKSDAKWVQLWQGAEAGSLHDATIQLAGHLLVRGLSQEEVIEMLRLWNTRNNPPSDENMLIKRVMGIDKREIKKQMEGERGLTEEVKEWVMTTSGNFLTTDLFRELGLTTRDNKKKAVVYLLRLEKEGIVTKCGMKRGCYRAIEKDAPLIDYLSADISHVFDIKWPFELEKWVNIYPHNVIVVAGTANAGKTAFMLNTVKLNMNKFPIEYFSSEMGAEELKLRLSKFEDIALRDWRFHPRDRAGNFADAIAPDAVNIVDYLEINKDFYEVGEMIKAIHDRLGKGIAIVAIQKKTGADYGRGGEFSLEKPRLYISIEAGNLKILKAKNWADPEVNPNGLTWQFKLVGGAKFLEMGGSIYGV
jgi:hypothetical protein